MRSARRVSTPTFAPMAILRTHEVWRRQSKRPSKAELNRLTPQEEERVRAAMLVLRVRFRTWIRVAVELKTDRTTVTRVMCIRRRATPAFAMRVARLLGVPLGDVLSGRFPRPGQCPMCGTRR
jgi:hypothetical protein